MLASSHSFLPEFLILFLLPLVSKRMPPPIHTPGLPTLSGLKSLEG